jgi:Ala-tRNA(Pro) deacylase
MTPAKISKYLQKLKIKYKLIRHKTVYTAHDAAATMKVKLGEVAKTLHVIADKNNFLVVLPASHSLDLQKLKKVLKAKKLEIAKEKIMAKVFKLKNGPLVPLSGFYKNVPILVDRSLTKVKRVIFSAGTFKDSIEVKIKDFLKITEGKLVNVGKKK